LLEGKPAVSISCSEKYRESIAHAFRELLESIGIHGIILSEAPRLGRTWTPRSNSQPTFANPSGECGSHRPDPEQAEWP
jgi:hypothetical protein